jgi:hypothetical protein
MRNKFGLDLKKKNLEDFDQNTVEKNAALEY